MKYTITYKEKGIEKPNCIYTVSEVAKKWLEEISYGVDSLNMEIQDENGRPYEAGYDGTYFLNPIK